MRITWVIFITSAIFSLPSCASAQPVYTDRDDSEFKATTSKPAHRGAYKTGDEVTIDQYGRYLYPNLKDLKYYEGPESTDDERSKWCSKNCAYIWGRGRAIINAIVPYTDSSGSQRKAYKLFLLNGGIYEGKLQPKPVSEGWVTGI